MRILFLHHFPLYGSGSGTYVRYLARELTRQGEKVAIVCPDKRKITGVKIFSVELPLPVAFTGHPEFTKCKLYRELSTKEIVKVYQSFFQPTLYAVSEWKPDIIHVQHASLLTWIANFFKSIKGINFIVTIHGTDLLTASRDKRWIPLTRDALLRAKKITPVSGDTKEWFLEIFGQDLRKKSRIIPGGINVAYFKKEKKEIKFKYLKKYEVPPKKPVILFSGKLLPHKGVKYLVKAAPKIKGEVFIIGDGEEKKVLKRIIKEHRIKNVHLIGYINDFRVMTEFYYRANVFVAPSVWDEPLGLVILEAMACQTPVVVTRKGGIPLAVKDGVNGFFIRPRNSNDLAEKVNRLLDNPQKREKMGKAAREIVFKKFTWEKIAQKFIRIYAKFVPRNKKTG
jgi:glycosyltransferase involved in cell wall biosynthesis